MEFDHIFKGAQLVTETAVIQADCGVLKGKIEKIGDLHAEKAVREHNCAELFILPGLIDMHVHFRDPGFTHKEDFLTGSRAAASGGITTVIDMPNTSPAALTREALSAKRAIAAVKSIVNYGFYMGASNDNLEEIRSAQNIAGVKIFMGSSTGNLLVQDLSVIEAVLKLGKFVIVHAEDENIIREKAEKYRDSDDPSVHSLIRPPAAAYKAVKLILHLAKKLDTRVHITHVSTLNEIEELRKFKSGKISADVAPHHLYLTQKAYAERGNFVKVNPPLRTERDRQVLWAAIKEGLVEVIATDHAPHTKAEKEKSYWDAPAGVPGLETLLPLLLDSVNHGELTLRDVARLTSANPARLLGIRKKGRIEAGYDADLVVVDMEREMEVGSRPFFTKCNWSPFAGWKLKGWPVKTMVAGEVIFEDGKVVSEKLAKEVWFS